MYLSLYATNRKSKKLDKLVKKCLGQWLDYDKTLHHFSKPSLH